jgi:hypothetical protein
MMLWLKHVIGNICIRMYVQPALPKDADRIMARCMAAADDAASARVNRQTSDNTIASGGSAVLVGRNPGMMNLVSNSCRDVCAVITANNAATTKGYADAKDSGQPPFRPVFQESSFCCEFTFPDPQFSTPCNEFSAPGAGGDIMTPARAIAAHQAYTSRLMTGHRVMQTVIQSGKR